MKKNFDAGLDKLGPMAQLHSTSQTSSVAGAEAQPGIYLTAYNVTSSDGTMSSGSDAILNITAI